MIEHFRDRDDDTAILFERRRSPRWRSFETVAPRKLDQLDAALNLNDLRVPPGNRLEALSGDQRGQHSIRIDDRYRLSFVWADYGVHEVEIADYH